jgi:hypothetical protein
MGQVGCTSKNTDYMPEGLATCFAPKDFEAKSTLTSVPGIRNVQRQNKTPFVSPQSTSSKKKELPARCKSENRVDKVHCSNLIQEIGSKSKMKVVRHFERGKDYFLKKIGR